MSEYTYGNLVMAKHKAICEQYIDSKTRMLELNEKWVCLVNEQDKYFPNDIGSRDVPTNLNELSKQIPILYFAYPEDHGFGFSVLHNGNTFSPYYLNFMAFDCVPALQIYQQLRDSLDIEALRLFECTNEQIQALNVLFELEASDERYCHEIPSKFKQILDINEMSFVSWDYINYDENPDKMIWETAQIIEQGEIKARDYYKRQAELIKREPIPDFKVGDVVLHELFGQGKVNRVQPLGDDALLEILFDTVGLRNVMKSNEVLKII